MEEKTIIDNDLISLVSDVCFDAGKAILTVYNSDDFDITQKANNSPLTKADILSHNIIAGSLSEYFPVLSEESDRISYDVRSKWKTFWLIDPLDGTKEFISRNGEFTVNIALINNGVPVLGLVYIPAADVMYIGRNFGEKKAYRIRNAERIKEAGWVELSEVINTRKTAEGKISVIASKSHRNIETNEFIGRLQKKFGEIDIKVFGSSLKLCKVAEGSADIYPRLAPTMEWDTAAADAVCRASGIRVVDAHTGKDLEYNKQDLLNPWFIAAGSELLKEVL